MLMITKILKKLTESLGYDDNERSVHINRKKAYEFLETGKVDEKGEYSVFG